MQKHRNTTLVFVFPFNEFYDSSHAMVCLLRLIILLAPSAIPWLRPMPPPILRRNTTAPAGYETQICCFFLHFSTFFRISKIIPGMSQNTLGGAKMPFLCSLDDPEMTLGRFGKLRDALVHWQQEKCAQHSPVTRFFVDLVTRYRDSCHLKL